MTALPLRSICTSDVLGVNLLDLLPLVSQWDECRKEAAFIRSESRDVTISCTFVSPYIHTQAQGMADVNRTAYDAELLARMRKYEKEHDIEPDWNVHAFQKAQAIQGQQCSVATEYVIRMLGLDICADTICGNHMMRGISGGQKKRVTSGRLPS